MANVDNHLIEQLKELAYTVSFHDRNLNDMLESKAAEMTVWTWVDGYETYTIKLPKKKLVDLAWVMGKINTDKVYQNFSENFNKLLSNNNISNSMTCYPTTYGIGILLAYNVEKTEQMESVEAILKENDIQYTTEYSEAAWVFRFKLSKSKENIAKMKLV